MRPEARGNPNTGAKRGAGREGGAGLVWGGRRSSSASGSDLHHRPQQISTRRLVQQTYLRTGYLRGAAMPSPNGAPTRSSVVLGDSRTEDGAPDSSGNSHGAEHAFFEDARAWRTKKTVGVLGSIAFIFNNVTGPGMVSLPATFYVAKPVAASLLYAWFALLSASSVYFLVRAIRRVPGNSHFTMRVEVLNLSRRVLPKGVFMFVIAMFLLNLQGSSVGAIVESCHTFDKTIFSLFESTYALEIYPSPGFVRLGLLDPKLITPGYTSAVFRNDGSFVRVADSAISPFGSLYVVSLGYFILLCLCVPLSFLNIGANQMVQVISMAVLLLYVVVVWMVEDFERLAAGKGHWLDSFPSNSHAIWSQVGAILFNFAFVVTIPSWLAEKKRGLSAHGCVYGGLGMGLFVFILVGWSTAVGFADVLGKLNFEGNYSDLLSLMGSPGVSALAKSATYVN